MERPDRVFPLPARVEPFQGREPAADHQTLPRREQSQVSGDVGGSAHQNTAPARGTPRDVFDAHQGARVEARRLGIIDQPADQSRVGALVDRDAQRRLDQTVKRALHHRGPQEREAEHRDRQAHRRHAHEPGDHDPGHSEHQGRHGGARSRSLPRHDPGDQAREHRERTEGNSGVHTVTSGASSANRLSPMPRTLRRSFTDLKPPRRCRSAMMDCA